MVLAVVALSVSLYGWYALRRRAPATALKPPATASPIQLVDVTGRTGVDFVHCDGSSGRRYIVETVTAGLALFDFDNDGDMDIYLLNGAPLPGAEVKPAPQNKLYRNEGDWHFTDVTNVAGVGDTGYGLGVVVGDYDNDGDADLFVNNFGPNRLYCNHGDGTFSDVTQQAGVVGGNKVGAGACFLDADADGDLDLYVANYVKFSYETHRVPQFDGHPVYAGPREYPFEPDIYYRNNGDGTFTDFSEQAGIAPLAGSGMGAVCADYDNDGDTDVFVLNDVDANYLWSNDGTGRFTEVGLISGAGCNASGDELGSMGVDCGDFDNDGWLDFYMTSYQNESPVLYRNLGNGGFEDVTAQTGAGQGCFPYVNWGTGFVDFDNDGDRDLFVACGHLQDNVDDYDPTSAYRVRNVLLMNTGQATWENVSDRSGSGLKVALSSRGAAFDDLDGDGDIDVVVQNSRSQPTMLENRSQPNQHWVQFQLCGRQSNRDGVGARVSVTAGDLVQIAEVHSGRGYQSYWGSQLHFGLGRHKHVDRVQVNWVGGAVDVIEDLDIDRPIVIRERR